jgi:hypothetical protein
MGKVAPPWGRPWQLPRLAALTSLELAVEHANAALRVPLADLPALEELKLHGRQGAAWWAYSHAGSIEVVPAEATAIAGGGAAAPPSPLRCLELHCDRATIPFAALPALRSAWLEVVGQLEGAASIGDATALDSLCLGPDPAAKDFGTVAQPWVCEALAAAPPSLRSLALCGEWTPQVADAVSQLEQLRVLALYEQEKEPGSCDEAEVWQNFGGPKPWTRSSYAPAAAPARCGQICER